MYKILLKKHVCVKHVTSWIENVLVLQIFLVITRYTLKQTVFTNKHVRINASKTNRKEKNYFLLLLA